MKNKKEKGNKKNRSKIRLLVFIIGLIILTFGARLILLSGLRVGGLDATAIGLSQMLGVSIGTCIIGLGAIIVIVANCIRKQFQLSPLLTSILVGWCYDLWGQFLFNKLVTPTHSGWMGLFFLIGILVAPLGAALYIISKVSTGPVDYLMLTLRDYTKLSMSSSRILIEGSFVILGYLLGGPIDKGTICIMLFWGQILQIYYRMLIHLRE